MAVAGVIKLKVVNSKAFLELSVQQGPGRGHVVERILEEGDEIAMVIELSGMTVNIASPEVDKLARLGAIKKENVKVDVHGPYVTFREVES